MPEFSVSDLMLMPCCHRDEVTCFKLLSQSDIDRVRSEFYSLSSETEQTQFLLSYLRSHIKHDKSVLYTIFGHLVCEKCFRMTYGIRYNRFTAVKKRLESGVVVAEHGLLGRGRSAYGTIRVVSWMRTFFQKVGDKMPTCSDVHLPSCLTKLDVYALAVDDLTQGGCECCSRSTFYGIWNQEFPNVKIPKVNVYQ